MTSSTAIGDDGPYKTKIRILFDSQILETKWESQKQVLETFKHLPLKLVN
jgi:hypothetical protein